MAAFFYALTKNYSKYKLQVFVSFFNDAELGYFCTDEDPYHHTFYRVHLLLFRKHAGAGI